MERLTDFVQEHMEDETSRLILDRAKWPEIDIETAVACIESRRKLKNKVPEWYADPDLVFPVRLSAEQCSSTATGIYKADLAEHIAGGSFRLADLTGGLGVDSWFFSKKASEVLYNEMQGALCTAAGHNFRTLGVSNIKISNLIASQETITEILKPFAPDIVYLDPARRGEGGRKVFLIEECTPDVLNLKDLIFKYSRHILLKLSPMADITMVCDRLGPTCREIHVVGAGGECKELLVWMDREWSGEYSITAAELPRDFPASEAITLSYERTPLSSGHEPLATGHEPLVRRAPGDMTVISSERSESRDLFLFEPGKAFMKAGFFNLIRDRFGIEKLGVSTHYYLTDSPEKAEELKKYGKVYSIVSIQPLDKRSIKEAGKTYPHSEVTARNIPMDTETLRKKLGVTSGDDAHIFGLKSDRSGNLLIITKI